MGAPLPADLTFPSPSRGPQLLDSAAGVQPDAHTAAAVLDATARVGELPAGLARVGRLVQAGLVRGSGGAGRGGHGRR